MKKPISHSALISRCMIGLGMCLWLIPSAQGQQFSFLKTPLEKVTEDAVKSSFIVAQIEYVLTDGEGGYFGQDSLPYFSRTYCMGMLVEGQVWFQEQSFLRPWELDPAFAELPSDHGYEAVKTETAYGMFTQDSFVVGTFPVADSAMVGKGELVALTLPADSLFSFSLDQQATGEVLAIYVYPKTADAKNQPNGYSLEIQFKEGLELKDQAEISFETKNTLKSDAFIGGGLFVVKVEAGTLSFLPWGVLVPDGEQGWKAIGFSQAAQATLPEILEEEDEAGEDAGADERESVMSNLTRIQSGTDEDEPAEEKTEGETDQPKKRKKKRNRRADNSKTEQEEQASLKPNE